jgi:hypothetical protein
MVRAGDENVACKHCARLLALEARDHLCLSHSANVLMGATVKAAA